MRQENRPMSFHYLPFMHKTKVASEYVSESRVRWGVCETPWWRIEAWEYGLVFETKYMGEAHATCIRLRFSRGHQPASCVFAFSNGRYLFRRISSVWTLTVWNYLRVYLISRLKEKTKEVEKKHAATNDSNASNIIFGYTSATLYTCDELWNGRTERSLEMFPRAAEGRPATHTHTQKQNTA